MSKVRDIARFLGKTEANNTNNERLLIQGEGGIDSDLATPVINEVAGRIDFYSSLDSLPTTSLTANTRAFVESNQRYYITNGSGWYNVALVNLSPRWDSTPLGLLDSTSIVDSATNLVIVAKALDSDNSDQNLFNQSFASDSAQYLVNISNDSSVWTFDPKSDDSISASVTAGDLDDSDENSFVYTFKWSDGINFVSKAITINYNFSRALTLPSLKAASTYRIGTTGISYNSSTKYEGTHSAYITGAGSTNRQPGYGVGSATTQSMIAYTIAMWIRVSSFNATYNVVYPWNTADKYSAGNSYGTSGMSLKTDGETVFTTEKYNGSDYGGIYTTASGSSYSTGTWYHIVASASNNSLNPADPSLYVSTESSFADKVDITNTYGGHSSWERDTTANLTVGPSASNGWYLHGSVGNAADDADVYYDDVRIYFGDVTRAEAEAIYNSAGDPAIDNGQPNSLHYRYGFNNTNYSYSV